jgi:TetR/AcrR family transcriptional repressor of nem operon
MRYDKDHKSQTRQKVLEAASSRFRRDGVEATGVAAIMAEAGLTHGGFYAHFPSKEALVQEALADALQATRGRLTARAEKARATGGDGLEAILRDYLRPAHRDHPERGCVLSTLAPELARRDAEVRLPLVAQAERLVGMVEAELPGRLADGERHGRALAIVSLMVGALQMSRVAVEEDLSRQLLDAAVQGGLAIGRG